MTAFWRATETVGVMHDGRLIKFHLNLLTDHPGYTVEPIGDSSRADSKDNPLACRQDF
jgi:hypothetical protein